MPISSVLQINDSIVLNFGSNKPNFLISISFRFRLFYQRSLIIATLLLSYVFSLLHHDISRSFALSLTVFFLSSIGSVERLCRTKQTMLHITRTHGEHMENTFSTHIPYPSNSNRSVCFNEHYRFESVSPRHLHVPCIRCCSPFASDVWFWKEICI